MLCSEIQIRDPYVVLLDRKYYLYGTTGNNCWGKGYGFDAYTSDDLTHFDGPFPIFRPRPRLFRADKNFWAPEMHFYRGGYLPLCLLQSGWRLPGDTDSACRSSPGAF